jgi:hypothetical protein
VKTYVAAHVATATATAEVAEESSSSVGNTFCGRSKTTDLGYRRNIISISFATRCGIACFDA